ncbi:MAG: ABC transporter ATP-binding protein [Gemmatimonadaceae bacterium]
MSDYALQIRRLGKRYRLGSAARRHDTLAAAFVSAVTTPIRNLREVRRLTQFGEADSGDVLWALQDVSFDVRHGETVGIIGRNGAGKSTLLKLLSRVTEPSAGRGIINGSVGALLEVGTGFHGDLTGRENIYLNGAVLGMAREYVDRRFEEIVEFAGVAPFIDTPVKRYSSGMYLRLAFAVAAHLQSDILIVDEVLAVGDAQFQRKCLGKMSDVGAEGRTVLFVSHNLSAVRALCSRAIVLRAGRMVADTNAVDAVREYVAEIEQSVFDQRWADAETAPQSGHVRIHRVTARGLDGAILSQLDTATAFDVEVEFETKRVEETTRINLQVRDYENNVVFESRNNVDPHWYGRPMPHALYRSTCRVPANLLNVGWHTVALQFYGASFDIHHFTVEALRLDVQDAPDLRGDYFGPYRGAVRPRLQWATARISDVAR